MYNVLIGMCTGGTVRSETMTSVIGAMEVLKGNGVSVGLSLQIGGYVAHNRNNLVKVAREKGCSHLMFIDNDMVFNPSAIQRLLDADKDIIGANYNARGVPGQPVISTVKPFNKKGELDMTGETANYEFPQGLFKVGGMGTGFLLIKLSVFDKLEEPYFVAWEEPSGEHHTEDVEFCIRARAEGFDVWCNPTIKVGHIGTYQY